MRIKAYIQFRFIQHIHPTYFPERDPGLYSLKADLDNFGFEETLK